jgi:hypothetical protein
MVTAQRGAEALRHHRPTGQLLLAGIKRFVLPAGSWDDADQAPRVLADLPI